MQSRQAEYATERANLLFGCYRRGEANDPDTYVAAVTLVLSKYAVEVIKAVTDPDSGLPSKKKENGYSGMPDVADVKEACEAEATRIARMQRYASLPAPDFSRLRLAAPQRVPGDLATIFVPASNPRYAALVKWSETADGRKFKFETRPGIWVAHDIWDQRTSVVGYAREAPDLKPLTLSEDARRAMADIDNQRNGNLACDLAQPAQQEPDSSQRERA